MAKSGLAPQSIPIVPTVLSPSAGEESPSADRHLFSFGDSGWAVAAPDCDPSEDSEPIPQRATHYATAADFFDLVFVTVALVAYSADSSVAVSSPRTKTHRSTRTQTDFQTGPGSRAGQASRSLVSCTIKFNRSEADTITTSEPVSLSSLNISSPDHLNVASTQRCPTGPPALPYLSIRGWTSRYA